MDTRKVSGEALRALSWAWSPRGAGGGEGMGWSPREWGQCPQKSPSQTPIPPAEGGPPECGSRRGLARHQGPPHLGLGPSASRAPESSVRPPVAARQAAQHPNTRGAVSTATVWSGASSSCRGPLRVWAVGQQSRLVTGTTNSVTDALNTRVHMSVRACQGFHLPGHEDAIPHPPKPSCCVPTCAGWAPAPRSRDSAS